MAARSFLFVVIGALFSTVSFADNTSLLVPELPFQAFSQKVLAHYPRLKAAHGDIDMALARQMQARAGFWPSLSLSAGYKVSDEPVNVFGMLLRQERFTSADNELGHMNDPDRHQGFSSGVHVELPLFDAMQTIARVHSARGYLQAAQADEAFTRMEALLMAQDAYLNALTFGRLFSIIDEVQRMSDEDLQKAKDLKDKGMILGADYYSAKVMLGELTRMKNEVVRQKKAMMVLLNILMGEPWGREWALVDMVREAEFPLQDQQKLMEDAFAGRPDLASLNARFQAFDAELFRERSTALPALSAFADAVNDRNKIDAAGGNNYTVGVKAELPLFDPSRAGRVRAASAKKDQLQQGIQSLKDSIGRDIAEESARYDSFRDNMAVLKGMADDAKEAVSFMVPLYSEGRKSIADLLEMRRAYLQSMQAYNKALMGIWMSRARLLFLTGRLNEAGMKGLSEEGGGL